MTHLSLLHDTHDRMDAMTLRDRGQQNGHNIWSNVLTGTRLCFDQAGGPGKTGWRGWFYATKCSWQALRYIFRRILKNSLLIISSFMGAIE